MFVHYLRPPNRRPVWIGMRPAQVDIQGVIPRFWCSVCGSEVFVGDKERCPGCEKEEKKNVRKEQSL